MADADDVRRLALALPQVLAEIDEGNTASAGWPSDWA